MPKVYLVLGPGDMMRVVSETLRAVNGTTRSFHRIQVEFDAVVNPAGEIELSNVIYYPVDGKLERIDADQTGTRTEIGANGCPYPPDCNTIGLTAEAKNRCLADIDRNSAARNIK